MTITSTLKPPTTVDREPFSVNAQLLPATQRTS